MIEKQNYHLVQLLKDSNYQLTQFSPAYIKKLEESIFLKSGKNGDIPHIQC
ncbi:TPA: hypothetical protein PW779_002133, partial [Mannheimia haemolytica]|nr:hypothetical protein [Mannheimia haemolytica]